MENAKDVTILIAEDDPGHARLIKKNLKRAGIYNEIILVSDGQQAVDVLKSENRPAPLLVMLDLNMPVLDGYQVLEQMKEDKNLKRIPVVILTTTKEPREIARCYDLGCNIFITKPVEYDEFVEAIRNLGLLLSVVSVPNGE